MGMDFEKDMDEFLNTDEFAQEISYQGIKIPAVFDDGFEPVSFGSTVTIETTLPQAICKTADVENIAHNETVVINKEVFTVVGIQNDGTGATTLFLQRT